MGRLRVFSIASKVFPFAKISGLSRPRRRVPFGHDEALAHLVQGGADALLRLVTVEVVTGVQLAPGALAGLEGAVTHMALLWKDRTVRLRMQDDAMRADFGWNEPARAYASIYRDDQAR